MFLLYYCLMVWLWLQMRGRLLANASNEETEGEWGEWDGGGVGYSLLSRMFN